MMHCHGNELLQSSPGSSCCSAVRFLVGVLLISASFSWEFAWGKKFTTTKLRQSVCQNLAPSPVLEPFVDKLPRLKAIHIHNRKQLTLGAYKITQVRSCSYSCRSLSQLELHLFPCVVFVI